MKTKLFIAFIFILLLSSVSAKPGEEELAAPLQKVWAAVQNDIAWQKFWFNTFVGEEEYEENIGKIRKVRFIFDPHLVEEDNGGETVMEFRRGLYDEARRDVFYVHIENSPMIYRIIGYPEIDSLPSKAYSTISIIEPDQLIRFGIWKSEKTVFLRIPPVPEHQYIPLEKMSEDTALLNMVKKSLALYIQDYYFDGNPDLSENLKRDPLTLANFDKHIVSFRLGVYSDDDPLLIVYCENTREYLITEFPHKKIFNDPVILTDFMIIENMTFRPHFKYDKYKRMEYLEAAMNFNSKEFAFRYDDYVNAETEK